MFKNTVVIALIVFVFWLLGHLAAIIGWMPTLGVLVIVIFMAWFFRLL